MNEKDEFENLKYLQALFLADNKNKEKSRILIKRFSDLGLKVEIFLSRETQTKMKMPFLYNGVARLDSGVIHLAEDLAEEFFSGSANSRLSVFHELGHLVCHKNELPFVDNKRIIFTNLLYEIGCFTVKQDGVESFYAFNEGFANLFSGWLFRKVTGIHPEEFRTYSDKLLGDEEGYPNDDLRNKEIVVGGDMVGVEEFESVIYDFESPLSVQLKVKEFEKNLKELFERR